MAGIGSRRALAPRQWERLVEVCRGPGWRRVALARRLAAAALATAALVLALAPRAAGGAPVVVAARDLQPGAAVAATDLRIASWPADLVPAGALTTLDSAAGRVLAAAVRAGEPLTDVRLAGPELTARLAGSPDAAAVPVRPADTGVAALLRPGDRVDVVGAGSGAGGIVLAADVAVLAVLPSGDQTGGGGPLVLVAMPRELATRVAAASLTDQVAITLR